MFSYKRLSSIAAFLFLLLFSSSLLAATSDNVTAESGEAVTLTGTCDNPGGTVDVSIIDSKGMVVVSGTVACDGGTWSFTPKSAPGVGVYNVEACDKGGCDSGVDELTITAPPEVPTVDTATADDATPPTLTGTCDGGEGSTVTIEIGDPKAGGISSTVTCSAEGTWEFTPKDPLPEGTYDVVVCNPDAANCDETTDELTITPAGPADADGDGILDEDEGSAPTECPGEELPCAPIDTDEDLTPDYLDEDSDNDGIPDSEEAGAACAATEEGGATEGKAVDTVNCPADSDDDGTPDFQDDDSDGDGIHNANK